MKGLGGSEQWGWGGMCSGVTGEVWGGLTDIQGLGLLKVCRGYSRPQRGPPAVMFESSRFVSSDYLDFMEAIGGECLLSAKMVVVIFRRQPLCEFAWAVITMHHILGGLDISGCWAGFP